MMNDGLQTTEELTNMIYGAAQRSRGAFLSTANMVGQLGNLAGDAFSSTQELVAFAEQLNKQIALSGASTMAADAAMLQLTQGLSAGALRGEELNSILEQTPTIAQTIAKYLGMSTGEMREFASTGGLTAEIVKNALLSAAEDTNAKFEQMPMTFAQSMNQLKNYAIMAFQPVLQQINELVNSPLFETLKTNLAAAISSIASFASQALTVITQIIQWIASNWSTIQPILTGIIAGFLTWKAVTLAVAVAQAILNAILNANPLMLIITLIAAIIGAIAAWIAAVGGLQAAWLIVVDAVMLAWDYLVLGFWTGVFWVMNLLDSMALAFQQVGAAVANYVDTMRANVLTIIQNMVNGAIDLINFFIEQLNKLPGVSIEAIAHTTFGAAAQAEAAANAASRSAAISSKKASNEASAADRAAQLQSMLSELQSNHASRQQEIQALQHASQSGGNESLLDSLTGGGKYAMPTGGLGGYGGSGGLGGAVGDIGGSVGGSLGSDVGAIKKEVAMSEEDLKSLVDMAERQYINQINLTSQAPVIQVTGQNTGNNKQDAKALADTLSKMLMEQLASSSFKSTARAV